MTRTPETFNPEKPAQRPQLVEFLTLRPDEQLRIDKLSKPGLDVSVVQLIKLETPAGTDDVGCSDSMIVTEDMVDESSVYLMNVDLKTISDVQKNNLDQVHRRIVEIQYLLA